MKQAYRQTADHFLIHTAVEAEYEEMITRIKAMNPAVFMEDLQGGASTKIYERRVRSGQFQIAFFRRFSQ